MVLMDGNVGHEQPCYSSYINLRNVGLTSTTAASSAMMLCSEELGYKPVVRRTRASAFGCKHFPEVEVQSKANWSCEFCDGAKLIEHASRSNEAVSSLDIDKLLCDYNMSCLSMREITCAGNAVESNHYNKMGSWILRTRARDTPAN